MDFRASGSTALRPSYDLVAVEGQPLAFSAGFWTTWTSVKKLWEGEVTADFYEFLATAPNAEVGAVHAKAMPAILTTPR